MKAFVINLDRRPDRMEIVSETMSALNIKFERVSAIDGLKIDIWPSVDRPKAWLYNGFRTPTKGMMAAYLSHREVWKDIVAQNLPQALVFEDDVLPASFSSEILRVDLSSTGLDLLRLEEVDLECGKRVPTKSKSMTILGREVVAVPTYGIAAYIVTLKGAKKLLTAKKFWFNPDHFDIWDGIYGVKTGVMRPNMFIQAETVSDNVDSGRISGILRKIIVDFLTRQQPSIETLVSRLWGWTVNNTLNVLSFLPRMAMLCYLFLRRPK